MITSEYQNTKSFSLKDTPKNGEPIPGSFHEKELQKISQEKFRIGKVLKRKGDSWIDKKDLV